MMEKEIQYEKETAVTKSNAGYAGYILLGYTNSVN